jgi:hypothetical protein
LPCQDFLSLVCLLITRRLLIPTWRSRSHCSDGRECSLVTRMDEDKNKDFLFRCLNIDKTNSDKKKWTKFPSLLWLALHYLCHPGKNYNI